MPEETAQTLPMLRFDHSHEVNKAKLTALSPTEEFVLSATPEQMLEVARPLAAEMVRQSAAARRWDIALHKALLEAEVTAGLRPAPEAAPARGANP